MFFKGSRYAQVSEAEFKDGRGRTIRYKQIRFIPEARELWRHTITQGERLDLLAYDYYHDPERFWRICDANRALWPEELTSLPGRTIRIPPSKE